jgi:hypothetical protein
MGGGGGRLTTNEIAGDQSYRSRTASRWASCAAAAGCALHAGSGAGSECGESLSDDGAIPSIRLRRCACRVKCKAGHALPLLLLACLLSLFLWPEPHLRRLVPLICAQLLLPLQFQDSTTATHHQKVFLLVACLGSICAATGSGFITGPLHFHGLSLVAGQLGLRNQSSIPLSKQINLWQHQKP